MWWLTYLAFLTSTFLTNGEDVESLSKDDIGSILHDAMAEVLAQQAHEMSRPYSPPFPTKLDDFMRPFRPFTGVGNREDLVIDSVRPMDVYPERESSSFLYQHFNNSDYVAGISSHSIVLHKIDPFATYLELSADDAVAMHFDYNVAVKDAVLFTKVIGLSETLFLSVLVEHRNTFIVNVYEMFRNKAVVVAAIELKTNPSKIPKRIAYVQSSLGSSLVVLMQTANSLDLEYKQAGSKESNHYIEVGHPGAVDVITFSVQGHGYIAVAGRHYCDIYKLSETVKESLDFGRLGPLSDILDLAYFRIGFHHVLAVTSSDGVRLYNWMSGEFSLKQTILVPHVRQVYPSLVDSCRDEVLLVMVEQGGGSSLYTFSGQEETFQKAAIAMPEGYLIVPGSLASFTHSNRVVVLFISIHLDAKAFVIETSSRPLRDPVLLETEKLSNIIDDIQLTLDSQAQEIIHIREILDSAVRTSGNTHISGVQHFHDISASAGVVVQKVNEIVLGWEDSELTLDEYRKGADDLENEVLKLENLVKEIEKVVPDIVRQDQSAVITGHKTFTGTVTADTLMATSLKIGKVGDVDLKTLQKDVFRLDKAQKIEGTLTFAQTLTVNGDLEVETTVNGIDIGEEVLTTNTEQVSKAQMVFSNKLRVDGNLDLSGEVNGIDLSEEVVTLHGDNHIPGSKNFLNGIEVKNVYTTQLDGVFVDELYRQAFTKSGNQSISTDVTFTSITTNDIVLRGLLNGQDVQELERKIVRVDRPAVITGQKTFINDVTVEGGCQVTGRVNGQIIPDDLFLTDLPNSVTGRKQFLGHTVAHSVVVADTVDGVKIPDEVVTLSGDEEVTSTLYFADGIEARRDIGVEGLVDGVDISELAKQALKLNETNQFPHTIFSGPVKVMGDLTVNGLVNGVALKQLVDDMVFKDESRAEIRARKSFKEVTAAQVKLQASLNGYNIQEDFMRVRGAQNVSGTKTFKNRVYLRSLHLVDNMIGRLDVSDIYQQRINTYLEEPELDSDIEFVDTVTVKGNLKIVGKINGLKIPGDVVLTNFKQPISNKYFAGPVKVDNLIVDGDINATYFGGMEFSQFYNNRITLSTDQKISGDLYLGSSYLDKLTVSGLVNGLNITDFAANVMSKTKDQDVTAPKVFFGAVTVHAPITTREGVNGLNLSVLNERAFKLEEDSVVTARMQFEDNVSFTKLNVTEVNRINVTRLTEDSLKKTGIQHVKGETTFDAGFQVYGDIIAKTVNELYIPDDVLLKNRPQEITGQFSFESVGVEGDIIVNGAVNGLDLSNIASKVAQIGLETVIESNVTFLRPVHVQHDVEVTGKVNDVDLKQLFDNVLRRTGDQDISGNKVFKGAVTVEGDMDVKFVNGLNWKEFLDDIVWIHKPQIIRSPKTFQNVTADNVAVTGAAHVKRINGIGLRKFVDEALYIDTPATIAGPMVFKSAVEVTGDMNADFINGLRLQTDVVTIMCSNGPQIITGQKTFQRLKVFGDIYADSVNSYDLQKLYADTLLTEGKQFIEGHKNMLGDVIFKADVHPNNVNGMVLSRDLVTLETEQTMGPVTFMGDVFVGQDMVIEGTLNGVDLHALARDAVYLNTNQEIRGSYSFEKAVAFKGVVVEGTVNGVDLKSFDRTVTEFLKNAHDSLGIVGKFAQDHCELVDFLQDSLKKSYYALDFFELHQQLSSPARFVQVHYENVLSLMFLDDAAAKTTSVTYAWNDREEKFNLLQSLDTPHSKTFRHKFGNLDLVINIGINSKDSSVFVQGSPTTILGGFIAASVVEQDPSSIALLFPDKGTCDIYDLKESEGNYAPELKASIAVGKKATSIALFELSGTLYLAVSYLHASSYVQGSSPIFARLAGGWQKVQQLPIYSSPFVKHLTHQNYHYLVLANNAPVYETKEPMSIQVYRNSGPNASMFRLFQKVPFPGVKGIEFFRFGDLQQLHAVAWNETVIEVLGLEGESGFQSMLTLHGRCVQEVKPLFLGQDLYLAVGQQDLSGAVLKSVLYKAVAKGVLYKPYSLSHC